MTNHKLVFHRTNVTHDGEVVAECVNPDAAYRWLHDRSFGPSVEWLLEHEGYAFVQPDIDLLREEIERLSMLEDKSVQTAILEAKITVAEEVYEKERIHHHQQLASQWKVNDLCWVIGRGPARIREMHVSRSCVSVTVLEVDGMTYHANLEEQIKPVTPENIAALLKQRRESATKPWGSAHDRNLVINRTLIQWQIELENKAAEVPHA